VVADGRAPAPPPTAALPGAGRLTLAVLAVPLLEPGRPVAGAPAEPCRGAADSLLVVLPVNPRSWA
jgi:hypothetical protein